jgi:membrane protease YdiL (CAAX protease family)
MKIIKKLLFVILILISTMAVAGPLKLSIAQKAIPETAQMLLLGICLVVLAGYGRKRIYKK